jgi:hypothetical protein
VKKMTVLLPFVFVHSRDRRLGLCNEERLAARWVQVCVFNVGESEGADARAVDEEGC